MKSKMNKLLLGALLLLSTLGFGQTFITKNFTSSGYNATSTVQWIITDKTISLEYIDKSMVKYLLENNLKNPTISEIDKVLVNGPVSTIYIKSNDDNIRSRFTIQVINEKPNINYETFDSFTNTKQSIIFY